MMSLEVRKSNQKAIALYQKNGFDIQSIRRDYYQDNHERCLFNDKRNGGEKHESYLAIESSCDEMAVAILKDKRELLCNVVGITNLIHIVCLVELFQKLPVVCT